MKGGLRRKILSMVIATNLTSLLLLLGEIGKKRLIYQRTQRPYKFRHLQHTARIVKKKLF